MFAWFLRADFGFLFLCLFFSETTTLLLYLFIVFSRSVSAPVLFYLSVSVFCSVPPTEGIYGADSVTQTEGTIMISQWDPVRLNCTYQFSASVTVYPFWYVQFPNQPPRLLLRDLGREASDEGIRKGFDATHDKKNKSFHLWKPSSELSDSATYYCADTGVCGRLGSRRGNSANTEFKTEISHTLLRSLCFPFLP
uniref:Immunoglobulin V-set domain-containing protein n=1 Tax=Chrysemys picta bellii TaxID=8478 RepID=A0A8C3FD45_CHRPI